MRGFWLALCVISLASAFKPHEFRFCKDLEHCSFHRSDFGTEAQVFHLDDAYELEANILTAPLTVDCESNCSWSGSLILSFHADGILRVQIRDGTERFSAAPYVLRELHAVVPEVDSSDVKTVVRFGAFTAVIQHSPLTITIIDPDERVAMVFNRDSRLNLRRDHKSTGFDVHIPSFQGAFGWPEHADRFRLVDTTEGDPYRLFNLDVFEFDVDSRFPLYGSIPFVHARSVNAKAAGVLWLSASESFLDIRESLGSLQFFSESGAVDFLLMAGPSSARVQHQLANTVGAPQLPRLNAIGYHQCRWNYKDDADCRNVLAEFEERNTPFDFLWLDIEHTKGKRYFTWDLGKFPDPVKLQNDLWELGHEMVTIVDPHIKDDRGYHVFKQADSHNFWVKQSSGTAFSGDCWPGKSRWPDFLRSEVRQWWADLFANYDHSTPHLWTWNDMNEPSVFNSKEVTMPRDLVHSDGERNWEHRDLHNLYGFLHHTSTVLGLTTHRPNQRPFVLTRAFFAGTSFHHTAVWTGDNTANWDHLQSSIPMLLSLSIAGQVFCGADVGGFFGNPDAELFARWYEIGSWQPFFRGHAHIETARREPWSFDEDTFNSVRTQLVNRYRFLPYWYSLFFNAELTGAPPMRPLWWEFEHARIEEEDMYMVGPHVLVAPAVKRHASEITVSLPDTVLPWLHLLDAVNGEANSFHGRVTIPAPIGKPAILLRPGAIIPTWARLRRSASIAKSDPISLLVYVDAAGTASGMVYMDDGTTFAYKRQSFGQLEVRLDGNVLSAVRLNPTVHDSPYTVGAGASALSFNHPGFDSIRIFNLNDNFVSATAFGPHGEQAVQLYRRNADCVDLKLSIPLDGFEIHFV